MSAIWRVAVEELEKGCSFVLATILNVEGSSPRHVGTRFLVRQDGSIVGTIGGGLFEANVRELASSALRQGTSHLVNFSFRGGDAASGDMICGGEAQVLMEFVAPDNSLRREIFRRLADLTKNRRIGFLFSDIRIPTGGTGEIRHLFIEDGAAALGGFERADEAVKAMPERRLIKQAQFLNVPGIENPVFLECLRPGGTAYIFGAGHVGVCVAHLASYVDFRVVALDDRAEFASSRRIPDADEVVVLDSFHRASEYVRLDEESYVVIVTRGHAHDQTALRFALRTRAAYIGMIGSRRKTRMIYDALLKEGFTQADLDRVRSPIGLPIGGETPQEIAVSIIAEMIQARTSNA